MRWFRWNIPKRRWRTMSLRVLMLLIALVAIWLGRETNRARRQERAIAIIEKAGGQFLYDDLVDEENAGSPVPRRAAWKNWLMRVFGDDYVRRARMLDFGPYGIHRRLSEESWNTILELDDLVSLNLRGFDIDDGHLAGLRRLTGLRWLSLSSNLELTSAGLAHLEGLRHLSDLDLATTYISDEGLAHLSGLTQLTSLDLVYTDTGDAGLAHLRGLSKLQSLFLRGTRVTDAGLAHLRAMHELFQLDLAGTEITDAGLADVAAFTKLCSLMLDGTQITDAGMAHLAKLDKLEQVTIHDTTVGDPGIDHVKRLPRLKFLGTSGSRVSPEATQLILQANPAITIE
jgi:hypothetical protein